MRNRKMFFFMLYAATLMGCSVFPETKEELLTSGRKSPEYCLSQERSLVEHRVGSYLEKCYKPTYVTPGNGPGFATYNQVKKESVAGRTEYSIYSPTGTGAGYFLNALIVDGQAECKTRMSVTAYNFAWAFQFEKLNRIAMGESLSCHF